MDKWVGEDNIKVVIFCNKILQDDKQANEEHEEIEKRNEILEKEAGDFLKNDEHHGRLEADLIQEWI